MHTDDQYVYFSTADNEAIQFNPKLEQDEFSYAGDNAWTSLANDTRSGNVENHTYDRYCHDYPNGRLVFRRPLHLWAQRPNLNPHFL